MYRRPPESTRTDPLLPYTPRFRSLLSPPGAENSVRLGWQGCADAGLCYPPQTREVSLTGNGTAAAPGLAEDQALVSGLESQALAWSLLVFFGLGLLLAFTPCSLPMLPILAGIVVGRDRKSTRLNSSH